jgi:hypothetical protein
LSQTAIPSDALPIVPFESAPFCAAKRPTRFESLVFPSVTLLEPLRDWITEIASFQLLNFRLRSATLLAKLLQGIQ